MGLGHERPSSVRDVVCFRVTSRFLSHRTCTTYAQLSQKKQLPLVEHARVLSSLREAPPKHAGPQRVPRELRSHAKSVIIVTVRSPEEPPTRRCGCQSCDHLPRARSRFEFDFRQCDFLKDSNFWCVQSSITCNENVHVHVLWPVCTHAIPCRMLWCP